MGTCRHAGRSLLRRLTARVGAFVVVSGAVACTEPPADDCAVASDCRDGEVCVEGVCKKSEVVFLNAGGEGEGEGGEGEVAEGEGDVEAPTATLTADVSTVLKGHTTTLTFSSTNAASCSIDNGVGDVGTAGTRVVLARDTTTFTLTCVGPGGSDTAAVTTTVEACARDCTLTMLSQLDAHVTCTDGADVDFTGVLNLSFDDGVSGLYVEAEVCDPTGAVFHIADSFGADMFGGDNPVDFEPDGVVDIQPTCHDAEVYLNGTTLEGFADDDARAAQAGPLFSLANAVPAVGCSTVALTIDDGFFQVLPPTGPAFTSPTLLRLSPPACTNGQDGQLDRSWALAVNSTAIGRTDRLGTGLQTLSICLR